MTTKHSLLGPISALILASTCLPGALFAGGDEAPVERYEREDRRVERDYVPEYREYREYRPQPRTVYIIIKERPVRRLVYAAPAGGYYCIEGGRRVIVREP